MSIKANRHSSNEITLRRERAMKQNLIFLTLIVGGMVATHIYFSGLSIGTGRGNITTSMSSTDKQSPSNIPPNGKPFSNNMVDIGIQETFRKLSGPNISQDNPDLIRFLRDKMIDPPRPYMSKLSSLLYQTPQALEVNKILGGKENGFFVECGAFDGERASNTIWLEQEKHWRGFLMEMDPSFYLQLRGKNRKSHSVNACLSPKPYPTIFKWEEEIGQLGKLSSNVEGSPHLSGSDEVFCFPFFSLMLAMNVSHVDYFSLDVEGQELQVLKTIPFDKIDISVITVEYVHGDKQGIRDFMKDKGYKFVKQLNFADHKIRQYTDDYVYVKEAITKKT